MALDHAVWVWNHLPKQGVKYSPLELFSVIQSNHTDLRRLHIWGYLAYFLNPQLQVSGFKIPKWRKHSHLGKIWGFSPHHSTIVGIISHTITGNISPQFHVVYDDHFTTVSTTFNDPADSLNTVFLSSEWRDLLTLGEKNYLAEDSTPPPLGSDWAPDPPDTNPPPAIPSQPPLFPLPAVSPPAALPSSAPSPLDDLSDVTLDPNVDEISTTDVPLLAQDPFFFFERIFQLMIMSLTIYLRNNL